MTSSALLASLPEELHLDPSLGPWLQLAILMVATLVSEDLTCVTAGLLVHYGKLDSGVALLGCLLGIYVGDLGLWMMGRVAGRWLLRRRSLRGWLPERRLEDLGAWLNRRGWVAILASRFLPGTRLPLYVTAGVLGQRFGIFALSTAVAVLLWTPLVVTGAAVLGEAFVTPFTYLIGPGWIALLLGAALFVVGIRVITLACTSVGRGKLMARVSPLWRWEFWPSWLFYLPILPWLAYLSVRYRGVLVWTAANPGIPHGGVVGESKYEILAQLPREWVVPTLLVSPGDVPARLERVRQAIEAGSLALPLILKPDAAQRGSGVKRVRNLSDVEKYLCDQPSPVVAQTYHPGPFEAGVFYYRLPGEETGHIFSITDKIFPVLVGDGKATLEELIWRHPRYRMQAGKFLARHQDDRRRVLAEGERLPLAVAGNHCQGTMFCDGAPLITPELEQAINAIARPFDGFYIGRFDIRYTDPAGFRAGRDLAIVELNGVTSESTNIYDPSWFLWCAYRTLYRQWALLYRIGAANQQRGYKPTAILALYRLVRDYYRHLHVDPLAD